MGEVYSFFFLRDMAVFKKSATFNGLKLMPVSKVKTPSSSKSDVNRQTDRQTDYCNPLAHAR